MEIDMVRLVLIAALLGATQVHAASRFSAADMNCRSLQQGIAAAGVAIVHYLSSRGNLLYGRYVRSQQFCGNAEVTSTSYIRTADSRSCPVKTCVQYDFKPD
ncbi:hypothetical protein [Kumtagia ephedrae]|uniref:Uncharacterized protein n=1 Tax=Kumtagia ephedrae TaxID=2116701 RepID=A0A2P7SC58_9HYPH|nr:hypothetical protein [Mesorhizobium ephedrae]PSJ60073.1 hypothetical protein C7I84_12305 [Mesorhizobium ephedrae]